MGTDVKLAGDVDQPLLGCFEVRGANTPWAIDNIDQVIYSCAAAYTHTDTHSDHRQLENSNWWIRLSRSVFNAANIWMFYVTKTRWLLVLAPTLYSWSSGYNSKLLGMNGMALALTDFFGSFESAVGLKFPLFFARFVEQAPWSKEWLTVLKCCYLLEF